MVTAVASALLNAYYDLTLTSVGTVNTIGVESYSDALHENKLGSIKWGTVSIGSSINQTIFVKSFSNSDVVLSITASDWNPDDISHFLTLSWDYDGSVLHPGESVKLNLVLSASPSIEFVRYLVINDITTFSCDIYINALEF